MDEGVTLRKLEALVAFMQHGNLARVAEQLGQSGVSVHRALHSLEQAIRCPLFRREGRNLVALPAAHILADYARRALATCDEGVKRTREAAGYGAPVLKLGSLYSLTVDAIPRLVVGLKLRLPALDIELKLGSNQELVEDLRDGRTDAAVVVTGPETDNPDWVCVPLFFDDIFFAAPVGSPYASRHSIDLAEVAGEKFVALSQGFATTRDFAEAFAKTGRKPDIAMRVDDIFSLINLVAGNVGYSLLPGRIGTFSRQIQLIPLWPQYGHRQQVVVLLPRIRERDPNFLALAAECRRFSARVMPVAGA